MKRGTRALWSPAVLLLVAQACGGPQKPGDSGDDCFRDNDCKPGLVCVAFEVESNRVCSNDVTGLVNQVPGPVAEPGGGGAGGGGAGGDAGGSGEGGGGEPAGGAPASAGGAPGSVPVAGAGGA